MRAVVQRVREARVEVNGRTVGKIGQGLLVFLGVGEGDSEEDSDYLARKIAHLRVFSDAEELMNLSLLDLAGGALVVSQFPLFGDCRKGRRPSFDPAAEPALAEKLYEKTALLIKQNGINLVTGVFGKHMHISGINDGPVTFLLDSARLF